MSSQDSPGTPSKPPGSVAVRPKRTPNSLQSKAAARKKAKLDKAKLNMDDEAEVGPQVVTVHRVIPPEENFEDADDAVAGLCFQFHGFADKCMAEVVFKAAPNAHPEDIPAQDLVVHQGLARRVAYLVQNGQEIKSTCGSYPVRMLCMVTDRAITNQEIIEFLSEPETGLISSLVEHNKTHKHILREPQYPIAGRTTIFKDPVPTWNTIMRDQDVEQVMKSHFCTPFHDRYYETRPGEEGPFFEEQQEVISWTAFCKNKDNLYSCWKEGEVPIALFKQVGLNIAHLKTMDIQRFNDWKTSVETKKSGAKKNG